LKRIATTFEYDMMPWSFQLEHDCNQLAREQEAEGDGLLICLARISKICLRVADLNHHLSETGSGANATLHISPLIASLDEIRRTLEEDQLSHHSIVAYISTTEVVIYQLALLQPPSQMVLNPSILDHRRTDYLMACLKTCKNYTESYFASDIVQFTTPTTLLFAYSLKALYKLATLSDAGWDPTIVRQTVDIVGLLDRCASSAEQANARLREETGEDSVFAMAAKSLRESAPNWSVPNQEPQSSDSTIEGWTGSDGLNLPLMEFSDDFWLNAPFNL